MFTFECVVVNKIWRRSSPITLIHVCLWCLFFNPHQTTQIIYECVNNNSNRITPTFCICDFFIPRSANGYIHGAYKEYVYIARIFYEVSQNEFIGPYFLFLFLFRSKVYTRPYILFLSNTSWVTLRANRWGFNLTSTDFQSLWVEESEKHSSSKFPTTFVWLLEVGQTMVLDYWEIR